MDSLVESDGRLVQVDSIPGDDLDPERISIVASRLRNMARDLRTQADSIGTTWDKLPDAMVFTGVDSLYSADHSAYTKIDSFAGKLESAADALDDYGAELGPIKSTFKDIKTRAQGFVSAMLPGNYVEIVTTEWVRFLITPDPVPETSNGALVCEAADSSSILDGMFTTPAFGQSNQLTGIGPQYGSRILDRIE